MVSGFVFFLAHLSQFHTKKNQRVVQALLTLSGNALCEITVNTIHGRRKRLDLESRDGLERYFFSYFWRFQIFLLLLESLSKS